MNKTSSHSASHQARTVHSVTKYIVQKFGGTSVGSGERLRQVRSIVQLTAQDNPVVVVVSAMSPETKEKGTTSLLLKAADLAKTNCDFLAILTEIRDYHLSAIESVISASNLKTEGRQFVETTLDQLSSVLSALKILDELTPRTLDQIIAVGEKLSAKILSLALEDLGLNAGYVDLSNLLNPNSGEHSNSVAAKDSVTADLSDCDIFLAVERSLRDLVLAAQGKILVMTGFFGRVPGGLIEKVGRGYTDFTAALVTAGLSNELVQELQVWKEVDGICSADPRRVPEANVLDRISSIEAAELTHFGSEVLHPFTMSRVAKASIDIRVKNTFKPEAAGTLVSVSNSAHLELPATPRPITAITAKKDIASVTVTCNRMYDAYGFLAKVFSVLKEHGVSVDLVSTSEVSISFTVAESSNLAPVCEDLKTLGEVQVVSKQAILAVVGEQMPNYLETAGRFFNTLAKADIGISMISKGASKVNISCVIDAADIDRALPAVHAEFFGNM